jgi:hypothetical protein
MATKGVGGVIRTGMFNSGYSWFEVIENYALGAGDTASGHCSEREAPGGPRMFCPQVVRLYGKGGHCTLDACLECLKDGGKL